MKKFNTKWAIISAALRQQFSFSHESANSFRIIFSSWLLACLVLTSSYSGCLHSLMAFPLHIKTINTINELAIAQRNGEIQAIATGSSAYFHALKVCILNSVNDQK